MTDGQGCVIALKISQGLKFYFTISDINQIICRYAAYSVDSNKLDKTRTEKK